MARPLQLQAHGHHLSSFGFTASSTTTLLLAVAAIAAVSSVIFSLCTNHDRLSKHLSSSKNKSRQHQLLPTSPPRATTAGGTDHRRLVTALSGISSKVLVVAKMVSWKKPDSDGDYSDDGDGDDVVWKKSILMGEKCRPLDFSGQILYDTEGKEVKALPSRATERGAGGGGGGDHKGLVGSFREL
ncbi:Uncharacterized protein M6B38_236165 [Iris pallida]|uniref:Uncharacterized protein n=1 Tax=Iris pallida TaxID=29817 RepID=A0AAX6DNU7_IRIPA|nr:Uncharacterized protein M6B38_236165 [Iris pallida]